ncbi:MAG TPA: hypothetical protein VJY31_09375 [Buttiauxella sp.]|nr:hypothetical protein [Buttiauxella sp.]
MKGIALAAIMLLPMSAYASSYQCEALQQGQLGSGGKTVTAQSSIDIDGKDMHFSLNGVSWDLSYIGEKQIAKMYSTDSGNVAVSFIDGNPIIFVLHLVNDDGRKGTYNLSECTEQ